MVDVRMPPTFTDEGLRAAGDPRGEYPDVGVLVLSQYVEERYASELIGGNPGGVGYLLKDRVADVDQFIEGLRRVAGGGAALDPEVISQLLVRSRKEDPLAVLSPREQDVLRAMAEGRSNAGIAQALVVGEGAIEKHQQHLPEAAPGADRRRAPPRSRRAEVPGDLMRLTNAQRAMLLLGLVPLLALAVAGAAVTVGMIRGKLGYSYANEFAA